MNDPRTDVTHPIERGQIYKDSRGGGKGAIVYLDEEVVLLKFEGAGHRLENRKHFERCVGSDRYSLTEDQDCSERIQGHEEVNYMNIDGVGEKTAEALQREDYVTKRDIQRADDEELLQVSGVGESNLERIKERV